MLLAVPKGWGEDSWHPQELFTDMAEILFRAMAPGELGDETKCF